MDQTTILLTSMTIGIVGWGLIAKIWVIPGLKDYPLHAGLALLTIPHVFRYIGLSFLITGVTNTPLDTRFAVPAAYGDLLAAFLALIAVIALMKTNGVRAHYFNKWGQSTLFPDIRMCVL